MIKYFPILVLILFPKPSKCQLLEFERKVSTSFDIENVSIDNEGQLYLTTNNGNLFKYNEKGDSLYSYSPVKHGKITIIDASRGLKVFLFYADFQEYVFLDRYLRPSPSYRISKDNLEYTSMATPGSDDNLWLIEPGDYSIKKYNTKTSQVEINTSLYRLIPIRNNEISFMREYQNKLYLVDANSSIYIFDNMGNYLRLLPQKDPLQGFIGSEMYFLSMENIYFIDIYSGKRKDIKIPREPATHALFVQLSENRLYLFEKRSIVIFRMI